MLIFEFLGQFISGVLIGYLALINVFAYGIQSLLPSETTHIEVTEEAREPTVALKDLEEEVKNIPSEYQFGGPIPKILIENTEYQQAAVAESDPQNEALSTTTLLTLPERVERSLVNIFCQYKTDEYIRTTTGTGYFIHQNGVVLTNAHVAQFLLLDEAVPGIIDAGCILRSGSPARAMYHAELLYISPAWINQNANLIAEEKPRGTGERDYALLYVSHAVEGVTLPQAFPSLSFDTALLRRDTKGTDVLTAGYPAETFYEVGAHATLTPIVATTTVGELYTFGSNYADLFVVSGSSVGEQGASGGPIINTDGNAIGLIVTKGNEEIEGARSLRAITLSYIDRTIQEETGFSLSENMRGDLSFRGVIFKEALIPFLTQLLAYKLE